ncbi:MAG: hypothetical protein ACYC9O_01010 [Candidatus Latescibacterota bacterium]
MIDVTVVVHIVHFRSAGQIDNRSGRGICADPHGGRSFNLAARHSVRAGGDDRHRSGSRVGEIEHFAGGAARVGSHDTSDHRQAGDLDINGSANAGGSGQVVGNTGARGVINRRESYHGGVIDVHVAVVVDRAEEVLDAIEQLSAGKSLRIVAGGIELQVGCLDIEGDRVLFDISTSGESTAAGHGATDSGAEGMTVGHPGNGFGQIGDDEKILGLAGSDYLIGIGIEDNRSATVGKIHRGGCGGARDERITAVELAIFVHVTIEGQPRQLSAGAGARIIHRDRLNAAGGAGVINRGKRRQHHVFLTGHLAGDCVCARGYIDCNCRERLTTHCHSQSQYEE